MPWNAGRITDFTVGTDKLDVGGLYTNGYKGADPIADRYVTFQSDGAGGTKVMMDADGPNGPSTLSFHVTTLQGVSPNGLTAANVFGGTGGGGTTPPPPSTGAGQVLTSPYPGATLQGGAGADVLNASRGPDTLIGAAGADRFVFGDLPWNAGHVRDFAPGSDIIDLRGIFDDVGYAGTDPVRDGYLRLQADGAGGTRVLVDQDGWGGAHPWPITITTLDGVAQDRLGAADWLFQ
jgi:serralysin